MHHDSRNKPRAKVSVRIEVGQGQKVQAEQRKNKWRTKIHFTRAFSAGPAPNQNSWEAAASCAVNMPFQARIAAAPAAASKPKW
jgi:hypothetical protein